MLPGGLARRGACVMASALVVFLALCLAIILVLAGLGYVVVSIIDRVAV